jgi:hypothetical protein
MAWRYYGRVDSTNGFTTLRIAYDEWTDEARGELRTTCILMKDGEML